MKKTITSILLLLATLFGLNSNAAIYIVGEAPFGDWDPNGGVEMTYEGDGTYTYTTAINGPVYFVFADGLNSDWETFNNNYRYGPANGDITVNVDQWISTQKAGDHGAYLFYGSGENYTITFDETRLQFKIIGYVDPLPPVETYTVAGPKNVFGSDWDATDVNNDMAKGNDGIYTWSKENVELNSDFEFKIVGNHQWINEWPQGYGNNWIAHIVEPGIYTIVITFNPNNKEITCDLSLTENPGPEPLYGDLNGDGSVNISDINIIIYSILDDEQNMEYDLNGDGSVNISDITLLIDCILSGHAPKTKAPIATLERRGAELWCNITGEGDIYIDFDGTYVNDQTIGSAPVDYLVATQTTDYQSGAFTVYAIAQGKEPSDPIYVEWELEPKPIEYAETPVLTYDEETLTVTATSADNVMLIIDGEEVEGNSYTFVKQAFEVSHEVQAYAYADGKENSAWAYLFVTVPAKPFEEFGFGDMPYVEDGTQVVFTHNATVLWQKNLYLYAMDETGPGLIYGNTGQTYSQGDVIPAGFGGTKKTYMDEPEIQAATGFEPAIDNVTVTPMEITPSMVSHELWAHYIVVRNVRINDYENSNGVRTITTEGGEESVIYSGTFFVDLPEDLTQSYDIYGVIASYKSTYQILPTRFEPAQ